LAAVGWWGLSDWRAAQPQGVAIVDQVEVPEVFAGLAEWQAECQAANEAWDRGERPDLADQIGTVAADTVERCRGIVRMRPREWATE
jgi:hypothetical protein